VSGLGPMEMAEVLSVQSGEMLRIWRLARHSIQPEMLPGLADGALESFFGSLGPLLARGAGPDEAAGALRGTLRLPPGGADAALREEWDVARQVLRAACDSLGAGDGVATWLEAAASAARDAALRAAHGEPEAPAGLVTLLVFSGLALRPKTV
jgi:hypothetical protein